MTRAKVLTEISEMVLGHTLGGVRGIYDDASEYLPQIDRALGQPIAKRVRSSEDVASVVRSLNEIRSPHRLTAVLFERSEGVITRGVAYEDLPLSAGRLLAANAWSTAAVRTRVGRLTAAEVEMDGPIAGGLVVRLRVDGGLSSEDESAPSPAPDPKESRR